MSSISKGMKLSIYLVWVVPAHAQFIALSGRVVDQTTTEALPYASVMVKHSPLGTIANMEGMFTIHLPVKYAVDTLSVTMIGYESYQVAACQFMYCRKIIQNARCGPRYSIYVATTMPLYEPKSGITTRAKANGHGKWKACLS
jgi:CarboxypepD_reg-like domain